MKKIVLLYSKVFMQIYGITKNRLGHPVQESDARWPRFIGKNI